MNKTTSSMNKLSKRIREQHMRLIEHLNQLWTTRKKNEYKRKYPMNNHSNKRTDKENTMNKETKVNNEKSSRSMFIGEQLIYISFTCSLENRSTILMLDTNPPSINWKFLRIEEGKIVKRKKKYQKDWYQKWIAKQRQGSQQEGQHIEHPHY